jgi:hypothetical protein
VLIDISHPNSCTFCYEEANDGEHSPTEVRQYNRILFSFVTTEFLKYVRFSPSATSNPIINWGQLTLSIQIMEDNIFYQTI